MARQRLDKVLVARGLARTRSQAEDIINRGFVLVNEKKLTKPGTFIEHTAQVKLLPKATFVSRAGEKLQSVIEPLDLDFKDKVVLDVGSSTGGFTQVVLQGGARKVVAVDVGTNQMHPDLRDNARLEVHEQTDIRDFKLKLDYDIIVIDVSFISLRDILPVVAKLSTPETQVVAMVKPQFEVTGRRFKQKGVIKNDKLRREILKDFELWVRDSFIIEAKADSKISGAKGNLERFYKLRKLS